MLYIVLFIILLLLGCADFLTTKRIIADGGSEVNPIMKQIIKSFGINNLMVVKLAALLLLFIMTLIIGPHWVLYLVYITLILVFCFVVYHNIQIIKKQRLKKR